MQRLTQYMDSAATEAAAAQVAEFLATQDDFIAVRVLAPGCKSDAWRVQAMFADCGHDLPLPDGCRRVLVPSGFLRQFEGARP